MNCPDCGRPMDKSMDIKDIGDWAPTERDIKDIVEILKR